MFGNISMSTKLEANVFYNILVSEVCGNIVSLPWRQEKQGKQFMLDNEKMFETELIVFRKDEN